MEVGYALQTDDGRRQCDSWVWRGAGEKELAEGWMGGKKRAWMDEQDGWRVSQTGKWEEKGKPTATTAVETLGGWEQPEDRWAGCRAKGPGAGRAAWAVVTQIAGPGVVAAG